MNQTGGHEMKTAILVLVLLVTGCGTSVDFVECDEMCQFDNINETEENN